VKNTVNSLEI